jgi:hypothetical protein
MPSPRQWIARLIAWFRGLIGKDQPWLNTQAFLAKLDENLKKKMG